MIYDITQELFSCKVYPGDPAPACEVLGEITKGDKCNLTAFSMCAHNGTHIDAPAHFLVNGKTVDQLDSAAFLGDCYVTRHEGDVTAEDARRILGYAAGAEAAERILIAGKATVTIEAARVFADAKIKLIGNESQTVGPEDAPAAVHYLLLDAEVVLLEGLNLSRVPLQTIQFWKRLASSISTSRLFATALISAAESPTNPQAAVFASSKSKNAATWLLLVQPLLLKVWSFTPTVCALSELAELSLNSCSVTTRKIA